MISLLNRAPSRGETGGGLVEHPVGLASPGKNISESTEAEVSLSLSEGDPDLDSLSSIGGGESVLGGGGAGHQKRRQRKARAGGPVPMPAKGSMHTLNKLKAEIAMLQDALHAAEATDKTLLQGRLREYR